MANFDNAFEKLIKFEGKYVNDPNDKGGETYMGISRAHNLGWDGWALIDSYKDKSKIDDPRLTILVKSFYKKNYWDKLNCDLYPDLIAEELFEQAVNMGISRAVKHMQLTSNLLNRNRLFYNDIAVDGVYGDDTHKAFMNCLKYNKTELVYNVLNILQGKFYIELMLKDPTQEKFVGWFERIEIRRKV